MAKIVVIDGLARSGSTLLTSLIHSQEGAHAYRGVFHEPLSAGLGAWKKDYALHPLIDPLDIGFVGGNRTRAESRRLPGLRFMVDPHSLREQTLAVVKSRHQYDPMNESTWRSLTLRKPTTFSELDHLYQDVAASSQSEVLAFRWNQGISWISAFLRNRNHYWISIVRHPLNRAISDKIAFKESLTSGLRFGDNYGFILSNHPHPRHQIVYFEDLIAKPKEVCQEIFSFLGLPRQEINLQLRNQNGEPFRVESSDLGGGANRRQGRPFTGFELSKDSPVSQVSQIWNFRYNRLISKHKVFRDKYSFDDE